MEATERTHGRSLTDRFWGESLVFDDVPGGFVRPRAEWGGEVIVVGGGPSLSRLPRERLSGRPVIAVNNAYHLFERCVVYSADHRWWLWHGDNLRARADVLIFGVPTGRRSPPVPDLVRLRREPRAAVPVLSDPGVVYGVDSGTQAICLAHLLGFERITLAGIDMRFEGDRSHWHAGHPIRSFEVNYTSRFLPTCIAVCRELARRGVEVRSLTPTALPVRGPEDQTCPAHT